MRKPVAVLGYGNVGRARWNRSSSSRIWNCRHHRSPEVVAKSSLFQRDPMAQAHGSCRCERLLRRCGRLSCPSARCATRHGFCAGILTVDSPDMHTKSRASQELDGWRRNTRPSPSSAGWDRHRLCDPRMVQLDGASSPTNYGPGCPWDIQSLSAIPESTTASPSSHCRHEVHRRIVYVQLKAGRTSRRWSSDQEGSYFVKDRTHVFQVEDVSCSRTPDTSCCSSGTGSRGDAHPVDEVPAEGEQPRPHAQVMVSPAAMKPTGMLPRVELPVVDFLAMWQFVTRFV
jgi:hypothetical protein